jgi:hypothetical protein
MLVYVRQDFTSFFIQLQLLYVWDNLLFFFALADEKITAAERKPRPSERENTQKMLCIKNSFNLCDDGK